MLDWFTTIPGILITCGVVLLIIAIVLFILGNKKEKRTSNLAMNTGVMNQPLINDEVVTKEPTPMIIDEPKKIDIEGVNPINPAVIDFTPNATASVNETPVSVSNNSFEVPTQEPIVNMNPVSENTSTYDFTVPTVEPVVEEKPVESANTYNFNILSTPEPVADVNTVTENTSSYDFSIPTEVPTVEEKTNLENTSAYDFSIPTVTPVVEEVKPVQPEVTIYGGNDPLANTQVVTEQVNHEPYMATTQAPIIEPVVEPAREPFVQPVNQSVVEEPKINVMPTISIPEIQPVEVDKEEL